MFCEIREVKRCEKNLGFDPNKRVKPLGFDPDKLIEPDRQKGFDPDKRIEIR